MENGQNEEIKQKQQEETNVDMQRVDAESGVAISVHSNSQEEINETLVDNTHLSQE